MNLITECDDSSEAVQGPQTPQGEMNVESSTTDVSKAVQGPKTPKAQTTHAVEPTETPKTDTVSFQDHCFQVN